MINIAEFLDNHFKYILDSSCKLTCISLGFPLQWLNEDIMSLIKNVDFACSFVHLKTEKSTGRLSLKNMCVNCPLYLESGNQQVLLLLLLSLLLLLLLLWLWLLLALVLVLVLSQLLF